MGNCLSRTLEFTGSLFRFGLRAIVDLFRRPFEGGQTVRQIAESGSSSIPLIVAAGFALGAVMTLHTRSTLVAFGAASLIPTVQALAFIVEIGPLVTGLLVAGRAGSGIGAVLANMRATEQIDGIESLSIDSFKFLVVPRIAACELVLPILTLFMDFAGLMGGFLAEFVASRISFSLYIARAFTGFNWSNFIPPTMRTAVFGFIIGTVSTYFGYTTNKGEQGVGQAATNSVVVSSLLIVLADVILIKAVFFVFPEGAL